MKILYSVSNIHQIRPKGVSAIYENIKQTVGDNLGLKPAKLLDALKVARKSAGNDTIIKSVRRQLVDKGLPDPFGKMKPSEGVTSKTVLSTSDAEDLRKTIGELDVSTPSQFRAKAAIIDALDEDVVNTAGRDVYGPARDAAKARFSEFDRKTLADIQQDKVDPDKLIKRIVGGNLADLQALKHALTTGTPEQVAAWRKAAEPLKAKWAAQVKDADAVFGELQAELNKRGALAE